MPIIFVNYQDGGKAESGATTVKKTTKPSPTQINIFSALDEELSNPKKKEPPKKLVPKIELSRTYQPPAKSLVIQPPPPVIKFVFSAFLLKLRELLYSK